MKIKDYKTQLEASIYSQIGEYKQEIPRTNITNAKIEELEWVLGLISKIR
jgi:hypothetical protein